MDCTKPSQKSRRQKAQDFLIDKLEMFKETLSDMSTLDEDKTLFRSMIDVYLWVSLCMYVWTSVKLLYSSVLYRRYQSNSFAFMLITVVAFVTLILAWRSKKTLVTKLSWVLLFVCACDPLIVDYSTVRRVLPISAPPPVIVPLSIFGTIKLMGRRFACRPRLNLLGTMLSPAFTFYLIFGLTTGSIGIRYCIWSLTLLIVAIIDLQMKFGHFYSADVHHRCILYEQFMSIVLLLTINYIYTFLFSISKPKYITN